MLSVVFRNDVCLLWRLWWCGGGGDGGGSGGAAGGGTLCCSSLIFRLVNTGNVLDAQL